MKQEVLLTGDFLAPEVRARLESAFAVSVLPKAGPEREAFLAAGCDAEAVAATGHSGADAALIGALPRLKIVACYGVGYDCIDVAAATARGAWVSNTPDVLNDDTADLALALALAAVRRIPAAERYARGEWETGGDYVLTDGLSGRRLGMLGMGRIGGAIVRRALGFGMEISYHATARKPLTRRIGGRSRRKRWRRVAMCCASPLRRLRRRGGWWTRRCCGRWGRRGIW